MNLWRWRNTFWFWSYTNHSEQNIWPTSAVCRRLLRIFSVNGKSGSPQGSLPNVSTSTSRNWWGVFLSKHEAIDVTTSAFVTAKQCGLQLLDKQSKCYITTFKYIQLAIFVSVTEGTTFSNISMFDEKSESQCWGVLQLQKF